MKTSLNEIRQTENFLSGKLSGEESFVYEALMLINPLLKLNTHLQKKIYSLVKMYGRKKTKEEIEIIHQNLFNHPDQIRFQQNIHHLFLKDNL